MNIVFMGTPEFSIPSLKILIEKNHTVLAVVTTPDKERGRGQKVTFTAVKQFAVENKIPVYQPEKLKSNTEFIAQMKQINPAAAAWRPRHRRGCSACRGCSARRRGRWSARGRRPWACGPCPCR